MVCITILRPSQHKNKREKVTLSTNPKSDRFHRLALMLAHFLQMPLHENNEEIHVEKTGKKQSHTLTKVCFVLGTAAQPAFHTGK